MSYTNEQMKKLGDDVVDVLRTIYDPEIPVDIYELGLIYDVEVSDQGGVKITMTLTSPNCPVAESLPAEVREKTRALELATEVEIDLTFDPPWNKDMMSEEAKLELGIL
jgi:FeS assembly SUF system protein